MDRLQQIIAEIRTLLDELEGKGGDNARTVAGADLMDKPWADMEIRRDPPRTSQPSSVGKRMSECTAEYLLDYASFHEWKAKRGREENPPRLNAKGKPWYETDELIAKIARGWAQRASAPPRATMNGHVEYDNDHGELPF